MHNLPEKTLDVLPWPILLLNVDLTIIYFNLAFKHSTGLKLTDIGRCIYEVFPGSNNKQTELIRRSFTRVVTTGEADHIPYLQFAVPSADDAKIQERYWSVSNIPLFAPDGEVMGVLHCPSEITKLVQLRQANKDIQTANLDAKTQEELQRWTQSLQNILRNEREHLQQLFQQAPGFICVLKGPNFVFELANDAYYQLVGHRPIIGQRLAEIMPEVVGQGYVDILDRVFTTGEAFVGRAMPIELQRVAGDELELRYMDLTYQPMIDSDGCVTGIFVQGNDVTEAYLLAQEVSYQAAHDSLTGLHNRRAFSQKTDRIEGHGPHAILYMDIDHFKIVNDRCGHGAGDELLLMVAGALQTQCDGERDLLARLGGDEFALMRRNCDLDEALELAECLRRAVKEMAFFWAGQRYGVTLSAGVVSFGDAERLDFEAALGLADAACFLAKEKGRNRVQASRPSDDEIQQNQHDMDGVTRLREAMREDRLLLYGQKIVGLRGGEENALYEVLARLQERDGTIIEPAGFIPAAERYGLIEELDRHIISKLFARIEGARSEQQICYFVNISGITLSAPGFFEFINGVLLEYPSVRSSHICFEVTETAALSNIHRTAEAMRQLSEKGFRFALDDFGSGMASFNYLRHLPVQFVKIDGDFIKSLVDNPISPIVVEAVTRIAWTLNVQTIAESVESEEILSHLKSLNLDYAQGYALHRPEPLSAVPLGTI